MRYGIPLLGLRVAPRITTAEAILLVVLRNQSIAAKETIPLEPDTWINVPKFLGTLHVDALICGGIDQANKKQLLMSGVDIIDNVACSIDDALKALENNSLYPGYGFQPPPKIPPLSRSGSGKTAFAKPGSSPSIDINCLNCENRTCLHGRACSCLETITLPEADVHVQAMLEAAADISLEKERTLCRISELVYYCLEMDYRRIGIAFCIDLLEPTEILARLLQRYFDVFPVICKVGGLVQQDPFSDDRGKAGRKKTGITSCNPVAQAAVLNRLETDLNVMVGLCMGVDCVFNKASLAPTTTLFVKDKSLANNPIGALYSEYYIKEVKRTSVKIT